MLYIKLSVSVNNISAWTPCFSKIYLYYIYIENLVLILYLNLICLIQYKLVYWGLFYAFLFLLLWLYYKIACFLLNIGLNTHFKYCFLDVTIFTSTLLIGFPIDLPNIALFLNLALSLAMLPSFSASLRNSVLCLILYDFF